MTTATKITFSPTDSNILVQPAEADDRTPTGIYLPEQAKKQPTMGKVIAVGPGKRMENGQSQRVRLDVGSTVMYGKYVGTKIELDEIEYVVLNESDVLGTVEGIE